MDISRRFFVFGAGALTTAAFARRAEAFAIRKEAPLLIPPDNAVDCLYVTDSGLFYLGRPDFPEQPTWREFFNDYQGESISDDLLARWCLEGEDDLDRRVSDGLWEAHIDAHYAPNKLAFEKLKGIRLGAEEDRVPTRGVAPRA